MSESNSNKFGYWWVPLAMAFSAFLGMQITLFYTHRESVKLDKLNTVLNLVAEEYVEEVDLNDLMERSLPYILANLDPHCVYFTPDELADADAQLNGSFSGIGVSIQIVEDTTTVMEIIPNGPAEKAGLRAGDRIVTIDGVTYIGSSLTVSGVSSKLRGARGSKVVVGVKRRTSDKLINFTLTRDDIPMKSVDGVYMIDKNTGYLKVNQFGQHTYDEFVTALHKLKSEGAKRYIIDLRENGGGYLEIAVLMVNEFLPRNKLIVYTKGRYKKNDSPFYSDGRGAFQDAEVAVLIDNQSASASEVFAGAIQDNDRGLIIGNRSFGKGLVQKQFPLSDGSAIRLTISRYYTPSGRCIQKDFSVGNEAYFMETASRFSNGELFNQDSIKIDKSKVFYTENGRKVYGNGGIVPDIFVPADTTGATAYYRSVFDAGLLHKYAMNYVDNNRSSLMKMADYKQFLRQLPTNDVLLNDFVSYAAEHGVPARWYYINQSSERILFELKALIAYDVFGHDALYPILNRKDKVVEAALKAFNKHQAAFPIMP